MQKGGVANAEPIPTFYCKKQQENDDFFELRIHLNFVSFTPFETIK